MPPGRIPQLVPQNQFPGQALAESVQKPPDAASVPQSYVFTWNLASAADAISPWGRQPQLRDRQLRDFWPTESFLAGALADISFRNASYDWNIRGTSDTVEQLLADMLNSAIAGDAFGWSPFVLKFSLDLYTCDNGAFIELIRDPGTDANSRFQNELAPVLGIAHLDSNQCQRTGDPKFPVIYTDRFGKDHKLAWFQVIPFSEFPSPIEKMNGMGYCGVTRVLRLAQIMRSTLLYKDEKISGRHYKQIHLVSGVGRQDIIDVKKLGQEDADNAGQLRFIEPAILASLDPEKPVSTATIDLASLPDGFNFDQDMKWYITGLASCLGTDYQEFAPLPGGGIGSSNQSQTLNQKSKGKGPAMFMKIAQAFSNYGVLPRGYQMVFEDLDEQRELDKQTLRRMFQEEMALAVRNFVVTPEAARNIGIERGLYTKKDFLGIPENYGFAEMQPKQNIGDTGGNTISEDAGRTGTEPPSNTAGGRLRKDIDEENVTLKALLNKWFMRKEKESPDINLTIHNAPGNPPKVEIHPTAMPAPQVTINTPEAKTPVVNIDVKPTPVTINNQIKNNKNDDTKEFVDAVRKLSKDE